MPQISKLDHLVLTVADLDKTTAFYRDGLGMTAKSFVVSDGSTRWALTFGDQKINLHPADAPFEPKAKKATTGSADLCFLSDTPLADWVAHFDRLNIRLIGGPIARTGATGPIMSLYIRDPDGNLIEVSNPV